MSTTRPFRPLSLDHLLLHVRGLDEAERFYCDVLGCSVKSRLPQYGMLELSEGVSLIDIEHPVGAKALEGADRGCNVNHFAIATSAWDEAEMRDWLAEHEIAIEEERAEHGEQSVYIRDPSGNLVELLKREALPRGA